MYGVNYLDCFLSFYKLSMYLFSCTRQLTHPKEREKSAWGVDIFGAVSQVCIGVHHVVSPDCHSHTCLRKKTQLKEEKKLVRTLVTFSPLVVDFTKVFLHLEKEDWLRVFWLFKVSS